MILSCPPLLFSTFSSATNKSECWSVKDLLINWTKHDQRSSTGVVRIVRARRISIPIKTISSWRNQVIIACTYRFLKVSKWVSFRRMWKNGSLKKPSQSEKSTIMSSLRLLLVKLLFIWFLCQTRHVSIHISSFCLFSFNLYFRIIHQSSTITDNTTITKIMFFWHAR